MGFFSRVGASGNANGSKTIIAQGCSVRGELNGPGGVHVDGECEGNISGAAMVSVGVHGRVRGVIRARRVIVSGHVHGQVYCELFELMRQAHMEGDVHCEQLAVEKGGSLEGRCIKVSYEDHIAGDAVALPGPRVESERA